MCLNHFFSVEINFPGPFFSLNRCDKNGKLNNLKSVTGALSGSFDRFYDLKSSTAEAADESVHPMGTRNLKNEKPLRFGEEVGVVNTSCPSQEGKE